jgi:hypothetical protein
MRSTTYCVRELEECYDDSAGQGLRQPTVTWGVPGELRKRGGIVVGGHHFLSGVTVADPRPLASFKYTSSSQSVRAAVHL